MAVESAERSPAIADKISGIYFRRFRVFLESGRGRGKSLHAQGTFSNTGEQSKQIDFG